MRKSMTIRLDPVVLEEGRKRASAQNRTLTNYIETLMRQDMRLGESEATVEVIAPADIRKYEPTPLQGESPKRYAFRKRLFEAILDEGGY
jgi:hypothetical protein